MMKPEEESLLTFFPFQRHAISSIAQVEFEFGRRLNKYLQLNCQLASKGSSSCLPMAAFIKFKVASRKRTGMKTNNECMQQILVAFSTARKLNQC